MDPAGRKAPAVLLCRDCCNFKGRRSGQERRAAITRLCAAGVDIDARTDLFACDSYIPLASMRPRRMQRDGSSSGSSAL